VLCRAWVDNHGAGSFPDGVQRITESGGGPVSPSNVELASFALRGFYDLGCGMWALGHAGLLLSKVTITKYAEP
jgi:hypothetical protein